MIVRPRPHWVRMLFVWRGSILCDIAPQLIGTTLLAVAISLLHGQVFSWKIPLTFAPFSLIGLTLAICLGFRNSTSYARCSDTGRPACCGARCSTRRAACCARA